MSTDRYTSPLSERYASKEMQYIFSQDMKFTTWRKLWIALAETEMELGLSQDGKPVITQEQIDELKAHVDDINYDVAKEREKLVRHDVMSHVYAYGQQCPKAAGIIHLGATSCYVGDNTDIIIMNEALKLVHKKLISVIAELANFADKYKNQPTLAFTHFQPAQPTTVGKRATLWLNEFMLDLEDLEYVQGTLKLLGSKGTTGTQASFLELFNGDDETIDKIDPMIAKKMGFKDCYPVSGQTYSRKVDTRVVNVLAGIAASATKMSNDIRLLQHLKEVEEPFEKNQIGSSAMAYKRNLINAKELRKELEYTGAIFQTTIDSEVIAYHIARERLNSKTAEEAVRRACQKLKGAYALVVESPRKLIAARDPFGFKPLCIGKRDNAYIVTSETCALDTIGAEFVRDVEPGEVITITPEKGIESDMTMALATEKQARCVFEYIYFARPDSHIDGVSVYGSRIKAGRFLAMDSPVEADIVTGVPESGNAAALGYSLESGIPYGTAFVKNGYVGRTFIKPKQSSRESSVQIKLNVLKEAVKGKRVVMIDDSIVRGTTSDRIVRMLREAGATEVHVRISSPPFLWPCYFCTHILSFISD